MALQVLYTMHLRRYSACTNVGSFEESDFNCIQEINKINAPKIYYFPSFVKAC